MKKFEMIDLNHKEVEQFIEENNLSFICNDRMQVEVSDKDFEKLIDRFPEIDFIEVEND